jgi:hypothetical protein
MIKKIRLSNDNEVDPFLEGGARKKAAAPAAEPEAADAPKPAKDDSDAESAESAESESVQESDSSSSSVSVSDDESDTESARSSTLTIDMLAGDPLFVVLSHFLTSPNRNGEDENIVTVLKKISDSLETIAASLKK